MKKLWQSGQSLVELIIVMGLMSMLLPVLIGTMGISREGEAQRVKRIQATAQLREAVEAVRVIRNYNWNDVTTNGTYHTEVVDNAWQLASGSATLDGLTQSVEISDVRRVNNAEIDNSGSTSNPVDPSTKRIDITISWSQPSPSSVSTRLYLTRYLDNLTLTETTVADFTPGTFSGTTLTNISGGEVTLGAGGYGDWCGPSLLSPGTNLNGQGVAKSVIAMEGRAYTGTGENASGESLVGITIDNNRPPAAAQEAAFDGYKTNALFADGDYAYIGTDTNNKEVVIVNVSNTPYAETGYFATPNGSAGASVYVVGNVGYVVAGNRLYNFNLSSKSGSRAALDSTGVTLSGNGSQVVVSGNYAYVSIEGNTSREMEIVDVSNTSNLTVVGYANLNSQSARDMYINSSATRAYIATAQDASRRELFVVDISTKTGSRPTLSSYDSSGMDPKGVTLVPGNRVLLVGHGGEEYQVVNIQNESSLVKCGGAQVDSGINSISSVIESDGDAYSYIVTQDSNAEFRIIAGGPGGGYSTSGTFTSKPFDALYTTAFNYIEAHTTVPNQTSAQYQVAIADATNPSCTGSGCCDDANYVFVGPDGTESSFYTTERYIHVSDDNVGFENPGRCFKYRVYLSTTDSANTPSFEDMTINYSP